MTNSTDKPAQAPAQKQSFASPPKGTQTTSSAAGGASEHEPAPGKPESPPEQPPTEEVPASVWWPDGVPGEVGSAPDTTNRGHGPEGDQHPQPDQSGTAARDVEQQRKKGMPEQPQPPQPPATSSDK
jgi:hypothetical protein